MPKERVSSKLIKKISENVDEKIRKKFEDFLGMYKYGEYIYPDVVKRELLINKEDALKILDMLVEKNIAEKCFRYYCPNCNREVGKIYSVNELNLTNLDTADDEIYCENCDNELSAKSIRYYYRIIEKSKI